MQHIDIGKAQNNYLEGSLRYDIFYKNTNAFAKTTKCRQHFMMLLFIFRTVML